VTLLNERKKKEEKFFMGVVTYELWRTGVIYWEMVIKSLSMEFISILRSPADGRRNQSSTRLQNHCRRLIRVL